MKRAFLRFAIAMCLLPMFIGGVQASEGRAWFGLKFEIETGGFILSPTLKSAKVETVQPGSPAEAAGILVGDQVIEADDLAIAGAKASAIRPVLEKQVGQSLKLRLRRASGEIYYATMIGVESPSHR